MLCLSWVQCERLFREYLGQLLPFGRTDMTRIRPEKTLHLKCDGFLCFRSVDKDLRQINSGLGLVCTFSQC